MSQAEQILSRMSARTQQMEAAPVVVIFQSYRQAPLATVIGTAPSKRKRRLTELQQERRDKGEAHQRTQPGLAMGCYKRNRLGKIRCS